jgi:hypothetical protein
MSTAAVASATVEPAATASVEAVAAMESAVITAAVETAAVAATDEAMGFSTPEAVTAVSIVAAMPVIAMSVVAMSVEPAAIKSATVEAMAIEAVEPGAGADEDAAGEVIRSVVAVRSAGVRIVAVVTVSADWRRADGAVHGTYSNAHPNLCVGTTRGEKQNSQQSSIF